MATQKRDHTFEPTSQLPSFLSELFTFFHQFSFTWSIIPLVSLYPFLTQVRSYKPVSSRYLLLLYQFPCRPFSTSSVLVRCHTLDAWCSVVIWGLLRDTCKYWHQTALLASYCAMAARKTRWKRWDLWLHGIHSISLWKLWRQEGVAASEKINNKSSMSSSKIVSFHWGSNYSDSGVGICLEVSELCSLQCRSSSISFMLHQRLFHLCISS